MEWYTYKVIEFQCDEFINSKLLGQTLIINTTEPIYDFRREGSLRSIVGTVVLT